jgi:hypothetical protein
MPIVSETRNIVALECVLRAISGLAGTSPSASGRWPARGEQPGLRRPPKDTTQSDYRHPRALAAGRRRSRRRAEPTPAATRPAV